MDKDANKIKMAKLNATLYGVQDKIKFIVGDFFVLGNILQADIVVMSPPWGRRYWRRTVFPLADLFQLDGGVENAMLIAKTIAPRVLLRLPTNVSILDVRIKIHDKFLSQSSLRHLCCCMDFYSAFDLASAS